MPAVGGLQQASRDLVAGGDVPSGLVRVAAPADFFDFYQAEWIGEFLALHPSVQLDFVLADAAADLIAERIDVAFRAAMPDESNYVARRIAVGLPTGLFASPRYLAARGTPATPKDLSSHDCLTQTYSGAHLIWRLHGPDGREREIAVEGRVRANTMQALRKAAIAGLGIALLPGNVAADVAAGRLVQVLPHYIRRSPGMNVVYPSRLQVPPAVSTFVDSVVEKMTAAFGLPRAGSPAPKGRTHRRKLA
jgi:DNA-binding transcriptional LysR family regulator